MSVGIMARSLPLLTTMGREHPLLSSVALSSGASTVDKPKGRHVPRSKTAPRPGEVARTKGRTLNSYRIGALPILDRILKQMRLE